MSATNSAQIKVSHQNAVTSGTYPYAGANQTVAPSTINFQSTGTSAGSIDQTYNAMLTATTSGASVQLNGGGLTDAVGDSFTPVRLDALTIYNSGTNDATMSGRFFNAAFAAGTNYANTLPAGGVWSECTGTGTSSAGMACGSGSNSTLVFTTTNGTTVILVAASGRSV